MKNAECMRTNAEILRKVPGKHDCVATGMSAGNPYAEFYGGE